MLVHPPIWMKGRGPRRLKIRIGPRAAMYSPQGVPRPARKRALAPSKFKLPGMEPSISAGPAFMTGLQGCTVLDNYNSNRGGNRLAYPRIGYVSDRFRTPVSSRFQTGFRRRFQVGVRPVPDQCPAGCSTVHVTVSPPPSTGVHVTMSCQICGVMSDA